MAGVSTGISLLSVEGGSLLTNLAFWSDCDTSPTMVNKVNSAQIVTLNQSSSPAFETLQSASPVSANLGTYLQAQFPSLNTDVSDGFNWSTNPIYCSSGNFTVSFWAKYVTNVFLNNGHSTVFPSSNIEIRRHGDSWWLASSSSSTHTPNTTAMTGTANTWQLITFVGIKQSTNSYTVSGYLNTTSLTQVAMTIDTSGTLKLYSCLGMFADSTTQIYSPTTSYDSIGYWSTALTLAQITKLYNSGAGLKYANLT